MALEFGPRSEEVTFADAPEFAADQPLPMLFKSRRRLSQPSSPAGEKKLTSPQKFTTPRKLFGSPKTLATSPKTSSPKTSSPKNSSPKNFAATPQILINGSPMDFANGSPPPQTPVAYRSEGYEESVGECSSMERSLSVKNTFLDFGALMSPSVEPFYRQRLVQSCPSTPWKLTEIAENEAAPLPIAAPAIYVAPRPAAPAPQPQPQQRVCLQLSSSIQSCYGGLDMSSRSTRCPSMDTPAEWMMDPSPSESQGTPYAQFQMPGMSPYCGYASPYASAQTTAMGANGTGCVMFFPGASAPVPLPQHCAAPSHMLQPSSTHTVLSLADAIGEPSAAHSSGAGGRTSAPVLALSASLAAGARGAPPTPRAPAPTLAPPSAPPCEPPSSLAGVTGTSGSTAPPSAPPSGPALGFSELPSMGSNSHAAGTCKPCAFFHTAGCSNGLNCQFCHLCDSEEKKRRRKEKIQGKRMAGKTRASSEQVDED